MSEPKFRATQTPHLVFSLFSQFLTVICEYNHHMRSVLVFQDRTTSVVDPCSYRIYTHSYTLTLLDRASYCDGFHAFKIAAIASRAGNKIVPREFTATFHRDEINYSGSECLCTFSATHFFYDLLCCVPVYLFSSLDIQYSAVFLINQLKLPNFAVVSILLSLLNN